MSNTSVIIIDKNITSAGLLLQKVNEVDGFMCTQIFSDLNDFNLSKKSSTLLLVSFDFYTFDSGSKLIYILNEFPKTALAVYAENFDITEVMGAMRIGITGFIKLGLSSQPFEIVLKSMIDYGAYMSPPIAKSLFEYSYKSIKKTLKLSKREYEICSLLNRGFTYEEIAETCSISINTVRYYLKMLYKKFNVKSKIQLLNNISTETNTVEY